MTNDEYEHLERLFDRVRGAGLVTPEPHRTVMFKTLDHLEALVLGNPDSLSAGQDAPQGPNDS